MRRLVVLAVLAAVATYFYWSVRATGYPLEWGRDLNGYYNLLGRAFASGRLHLPVDPAPELLAQPNPWDPKVDPALKMHDVALYDGRYYLYHGAGPAMMLFAPWRLITGHDVPERFALLLLCLGGYAFASGALLRLLDASGARPHPAVLAALLLALGICQGVPYLFGRVWVYEIAIAGGYFCVSAAMFFLASGHWAVAGLFFGLAIACRPHLLFAGLVALILAPRDKRIRMLTPFAAMAALVAAYNLVRFDNPLEFGVRYLLTYDTNQQRVRLAWENLIPGLYYFTLSPPGWSAVFPWARPRLHAPLALPTGYFIEPVVGWLWLAPFAIAAWIPRHRLLWMPPIAATATLLFLCFTGFATHRYQVDYLPLLVLGALVSAGASKRTWMTAMLCIAIGYSVVVNAALALTGPYDELLKNRPRSYLRIAGWFSPFERHRPAWNPPLDVEIEIAIRPETPGFREPLLSAGQQSYRSVIFVEHRDGKMRIFSNTDDSEVAADLPYPGSGRAIVRVTYSPGRVGVSVNGAPILTHEVKGLVTAPSDVRIGENSIVPNLTERRYSHEIRIVRRDM
ncbi:MAG: hypothetical protein ACRD44_00785 [Bryobacteraceae bacterium]